MAEPAEALLRLAQVEEQFTLRLGGGDLDDTPVAQDELVHLGANPVHREGHEADAMVGIEALDGLHEADVAFLDQIAQRQAVAGIALGHVHDEAQVREHHAAGSFELAIFTIAPREILLLFQRQHGDLVDFLDVGIQAPRSGGNQQVAWYQIFTH
jgi:hypothetical protein